MASGSTRSDVRYHRVGESGSGQRPSSSNPRITKNRNFTSRKRLLPKIVAVFVVFSVLLFLQYGAHLFRTFSDYDDLDLNIAKEEVIIDVTENDLKPIIDVTEKDLTPSIQYQLNLEHCKIPKVELRSQNYKNAESEILQLESCETEKEVSILKDNILYLKENYDREHCCIYEIQRPFELPTDDYKLGPCQKFNEYNQSNVESLQFIYVDCQISKSNIFTISKGKSDISFHTNIVPSIYQQKIDYWKTKPKPPNVVVAVLDSASKMDGYRNLPKTLQYLINDLNFTDYNGYHVIGEPTMRNVIPIMLGEDVADFYKKKSWVDYWDSVPFIWKEFGDINYLTSYMEDIPSAGTFNYGGQKGFLKPPTDFYPRPFFKLHEEKRFGTSDPRQVQANMLKYCIGRKSIEEVVFNMTLQLLNKMNDIVPMFLMPWTCWPQHDIFGELFHLDETMLHFFKEIGNSNEILENTVIILMADHGFYSGLYANTPEGLLERRHPLFLIRLPEKLASSHPEFFKNIQHNANRITSHYDVYKTMKHLREIASSISTAVSTLEQDFKDSVVGRSLLLEIPEKRTCTEAGISKSRCACNLNLPSAEDKDVIPDSLRLAVEKKYVQRPNLL